MTGLVLQAHTRPTDEARETSRRRRAWRFAGVAAVLFLFLTLTTAADSKRLGKAPDFPSTDARSWIGEPQTWKALEGKVVILDIWTFG